MQFISGIRILSLYGVDGKTARLTCTGDPLPNPQPGTRMSAELAALLEAEG